MSVPVSPETTMSLSLLDSCRARLAVLRALRICRMPPEKLCAVLVRKNHGRREASAAECAQARAAVCTVSPVSRGSAGCLRRSVATLLLCHMGDRSATWCSGFALDPFRAHAWVEVGGRPVGEPAEVEDYTVVLTTAAPRHPE